MQANSQIACFDCDLLINVPEMAENHSLICPGCHSKQFTKYKDPLNYSISFASSAIIMLFLANSFPFLSFEAQGQIRTITLIQASQEMYTLGFVVLASLVYAFMLLLPILYLVSLLILLVPIKLDRKPFMPVFIGRLMGFFLTWVMVEVFIVGVLVALIKVIDLADIIIGFSFWAYIGFVIFFTLTANIANRHQLWDWIEHARH
jgi:paraquat-inducible protein A